MGAGRTKVGQTVDPAVGISIHAARGARVAKGDVLADLYVPGQPEEARARVRAAFTVEEPSAPFVAPPLVLGRVS
jgi:thymidine phosphorylase